MKIYSPKKARKQQRKHDILVASTIGAVKSIRKWKFLSRLKFACWLLWGKGDWKGVK